MAPSQAHGATRVSIADNVLVVHSKLASLDALAILMQHRVPLGTQAVQNTVCRELFRCLNLESGRQRRAIQLAAAEVRPHYR